LVGGADAVAGEAVEDFFEDEGIMGDLGRRAFEEEMKVGGLAEEVLGGLGATDAPIHIRRPVAARYLQGKLDALAHGFEGTGHKMLQVRDDRGRPVHLHFVKGRDALGGFEAEQLVEGEVRRQPGHKDCRRVGTEGRPCVLACPYESSGVR